MCTRLGETSRRKGIDIERRADLLPDIERRADLLGHREKGRPSPRHRGDPEGVVRSYDETPLAGASIPRLSAPESAQGRGPGVRLAAMTKTPIILQLAGAAVVGFATVALLNSCGGAPAEPLPPRDKSAIAAFEEENAIPTSDWYPRVQGFESSGGSRILFVHTDLYPDGDAKPIASQICGGYAGMTWERGARFTSVRVLDKADLVLVKCGYQP